MSEKVIELSSSIIKGLLPDIGGDKSLCVDIDTCTEPGTYYCVRNTKNMPEGIYTFGVLEVIRSNYKYVQQIYFPEGRNAFITRSIWDGQLRSWFKFTGEVVV